MLLIRVIVGIEVEVNQAIFIKPWVSSTKKTLIGIVEDPKAMQPTALLLRSILPLLNKTKTRVIKT